MHAVPRRSRRWRQTPWSWGYMWLLVLGAKLHSSAGAEQFQLLRPLSSCLYNIFKIKTEDNVASSYIHGRNTNLLTGKNNWYTKASLQRDAEQVFCLPPGAIAEPNPEAQKVT